jgi:hypothetical protein
VALVPADVSHFREIGSEVGMTVGEFETATRARRPRGERLGKPFEAFEG